MGFEWAGCKHEVDVRVGKFSWPDEKECWGKSSHVSWGSEYASGAGTLKEGTKEVQMILGDKSLHFKRQTVIIQGP